MRSLQLVLKDGFERDTVRVDVNGTTVIDESDVSTRPQLELALMRDVPVDGATAEVVVSVPTRGATKSISVSLAETVSLQISLTSNGAIEHRPSRELARVL